MNNKHDVADVIMPDIKLITVEHVYANMRSRMKEIIKNPHATAESRKKAVSILNTPRSAIVSSGDFGVPCSGCHAVCMKVVAVNNEYALCDSCLNLAAEVMAGGREHASIHAGSESCGK